VVAAMRDPNPRVAGAGLARLREAGIAVEHGVLEHEARELNIGFVSRFERGRPWVRLKIAATLDGRTALNNGASQWLTGEAAREDGHRWRARACAVLTGISTVLTDDPQLNVRSVSTPRQPLRVVADPRLELPPQARILRGGGVLVATAIDDPARAGRLCANGAEVVVLPGSAEAIELGALLQELARREVNEIHVEAGCRLNGALLREGWADELLLYYGAALVGAGRGMADLPELTDLSGRRKVAITDVRMIGPDVRILGRVT
jgi:diaminohydroxyphosphoribosylaminopyrimidine deaminase/5-amino-6-(5-phosphoribosylamino)uracil reductase